MKTFDIQKLRELPIEQVAQTLGLQVTKQHKALCPFHEDRHPSLSFHVGRNLFRCFSCGVGGGVIKLSQQLLNKNFKETCHWLSEEFRVESLEFRENHQPEKSEIINHKPDISTKYSKFFEHPYLNQAARTFLFQERKLHPAVIRWCRLTSWTDRHGTPWLQIPYYDTDGTLIGVQNRRLGKGEGPRFKFVQGSQITVYNLPVLRLLEQGEPLWICEGPSDCWALLSSGHKAVSIPSATLLKAKGIEVLKNIRNHKSKIINPTLHMSPDNDEPGDRLYIQLKKLFPQLVRHPLPDGIKDFSEWYMSSRGA